MSRSPILQNANVRLRELQDYFRYIVIPSRSNATLESVDFLDQDSVKAISDTARGPAVLYYLVKSGDSWKITVSD